MISLENRVIIQPFFVTLSDFFVNEPARDPRCKEGEENNISLFDNINDGLSIGKVEPEKENTTYRTGNEVTDGKFPCVHFS